MNDKLEQWKPVVGYPLYEVSNLGRVRSWRRSGKGTSIRSKPLLRKLVVNVKTGYAYVMLSVNGALKLRQVHVMVLEAFSGPRGPGQESRHLNGNSVDNRIENLVWGTRIEQFLDQVKHGTDTRGERNGHAKLTQLQANQIRSQLAKGIPGKELSDRFKVSQATICRIKKGLRYAAS